MCIRDSVEGVAAIFPNLRDRFLGFLPKYSKVVGVFGRNPLTALPVLLWKFQTAFSDRIFGVRMLMRWISRILAVWRILFMSKTWPLFFETLGIVPYAAALNIPKSRASLLETSLRHCLFYCWNFRLHFRISAGLCWFREFCSCPKSGRYFFKL